MMASFNFSYTQEWSGLRVVGRDNRVAYYVGNDSGEKQTLLMFVRAFLVMLSVWKTSGIARHRFTMMEKTCFGRSRGYVYIDFRSLIREGSWGLVFTLLSVSRAIQKRR